MTSHDYRPTLRRRIRTVAVTAVLESVAAVTRRLPAASPKRHGVEVTRDVAYGPDRAHVLDLYRPTRSGPRPTVLYVHGGAFHLCSKETHWLMGMIFARFGYLVANIDYRLAPKHPYPAALADTCRAFGWLVDHARELGGDPDRLILAGESAGGNLVTALALAICQRRTEPWACDVYERGRVPRAVIPFCAILQATRAERFGERRKLPGWADRIIRDAGISYLHGHPHAPGSTTELADPLLVLEAAARAGERFERPLPAFFAPVGTRDPLLPDTRRLAAALAALDVPCEARFYPGAVHAFHAMVWDRTARRCWRDALAFLDRHVA